MKELQRISVNQFNIEDSILLEELENITKNKSIKHTIFIWI